MCVPCDAVVLLILCSDANSACCSNCQYANTSVLCRSAPQFTGDCTADAYCNGISEECPSPPPARENTPCVK